MFETIFAPNGRESVARERDAPNPPPPPPPRPSWSAVFWVAGVAKYRGLLYAPLPSIGADPPDHQPRTNHDDEDDPKCSQRNRDPRARCSPILLVVVVVLRPRPFSRWHQRNIEACFTPRYLLSARTASIINRRRGGFGT